MSPDPSHKTWAERSEELQRMAKGQFFDIHAAKHAPKDGVLTWGKKRYIVKGGVASVIPKRYRARAAIGWLAVSEHPEGMFCKYSDYRSLLDRHLRAMDELKKLRAERGWFREQHAKTRSEVEAMKMENLNMRLIEMRAGYEGYRPNRKTLLEDIASLKAEVERLNGNILGWQGVVMSRDSVIKCREETIAALKAEVERLKGGAK